MTSVIALALAGQHRGLVGFGRATMVGMAAVATTTVEIDNKLLEKLRRRRPAKNDRELLESAVRIQLGNDASVRVKERFSGVSDEEIDREAVGAVREVRREMTGEQRRTRG